MIATLNREPRSLKWAPMNVPSKSEKALEEELSLWLGTPYMEGNQCRGAGVDCVRFVEAVLWKLYYGRYPTEQEQVRKLAQDAAIGDRRSTTEVARELCRRFPHDIARGKTVAVRPGDVIIVKEGVGPGHTGIVSTRPNVAIHAIAPEVSSVSLHGLVPIARVIRLKDKHQW